MVKKRRESYIRKEQAGTKKALRAVYIPENREKTGTERKRQYEDRSAAVYGKGLHTK